MIKAFMPPFQRVLFGVFGILALILLGMSSARFLRGERAEAQSGGMLLRSEDLLYVSSFRLPQGDYGGSDFNFSDGKIAYNPLRHSLYISGNVTKGNDVAEVSIPEIRKSAALSDLSTATVLQPFADISDGRIGELGALDSNGARLGGLIVDGMRKLVYWTAYLWYSYLGGPGSHGTSPLDLSKPDDATGLLRVGDVHPRAIAGYMAAIPSSWIARLGARFLSGQSNLNIVSTSSIGPAAIGFNPEDLGVKNPVPGISYVYYIVGSSATLGDYDSAVVPGDPLRSINGTAKFGGVVFPEGTDSVLFFGTQGIGAFCYGSQAQCNDPVGEWQGPHARNGDYRIAIWAYNAADFEKVRQGTLQPAQVVPYAVWNSTFPFSYPDASTYMVKGVAYDGDRRLYITTTGDSQATPVISVYDIVVGGQSATGNQTPSVNAGPDQSVALPSNATLNGVATDDGLPNPPASVTTAWSKVSGPGTVTFGDASIEDTTASFSLAGTYVLHLTASDSALSSQDDLQVTVSSPSTPELCLSPRPENRVRLGSQDFSGLATTLTITDPQGLLVYSAVQTPTNKEGEIRITDPTILAKINDTTIYTLTAHPESHRRRKMTLLGSALKASPCDLFPGSPFGFLDESGPISLQHLVRLIAHYRMQNDAQVNRAFLSQRFTLRDLISVIKLYVSNIRHE